MSPDRLPGRLVILIGLGFWTFWILGQDLSRKSVNDGRMAQAALIVTGGIVAWSRWRKLDEKADVEQRQRRMEREVAGSIDPRRLAAEGRLGETSLAVGTRLDLGPCPACAGGPVTIIPSPPGMVNVRCRGCGLIATPPELQPASASGS